VQVFEMLRLFWRRRRRMNGEPTMHELERDFNALMRGTKDGQIDICNESPRMTGGMREVVDHVRSAKHRANARIVGRTGTPGSKAADCKEQSAE